MSARILILDGHPDPGADRFVHGLAAAYREGAAAAKHEVILIRAADLEFPLLRSQQDYEKGQSVDAVRHCQAAMDWATHVVILYRLWLGSMPALLKGLLEQMLRPGFAFSTLKLGHWPVKLQSGKSARIVVTMGMPALLYRWYFRAHRTYCASSASAASEQPSSAVLQAPTARGAASTWSRCVRWDGLRADGSPRRFDR